SSDDGGYKARWHTENLPPGTYEIRLRAVEAPGGPFLWESKSAFLVVQPHAGYTPLEVSLERSDIPRTADIALWEVIRESTQAISFNRYSDFIDWVVGGKEPPWDAL